MSGLEGHVKVSANEHLPRSPTLFGTRVKEIPKFRSPEFILSNSRLDFQKNHSSIRLLHTEDRRFSGGDRLRPPLAPRGPARGSGSGGTLAPIG